MFGSDWPLVGRDHELAAAEDAVASGAGGIWLSGAAGVGKTRLAQEIVARESAAGNPTVWLAATAGMTAVPLGPMRHLLDRSDPLDASEAGLWERVERALHERATAGTTLVVVVDDAHHLDDLSAAFLHALATARSAFLVLTVRDDLPRSETLTTLWKDGLVERRDLGGLGRDEADTILRLALGGEVEQPTVQALWSHSGGNALLLRELTLSAIEDGALALRDGRWSRRGHGRASARLREVVATRLGRLSESERAALEYVAVGGSLPRETLCVLADEHVIDALEARGLLVAEVHEGAIDLDVSHSVFADVLRDALDAPRLRVLRRRLVNVAAGTSRGGRRDDVRVAILRHEAGETVDPLTLQSSARAVLWNAGHLLAEHLSDTARSQTMPLGSEGRVALRLARAAWEQSGDLASGIELAVTHAWLGQTAEAAELLAKLEASAGDDEERARLAGAQATLLFWSLGRPDDAQRVLRDAEDACAAIAGTELHRDLRRARGGIALNVARPAEALALSEAVVAEGPDDLASARARPTIAAALSMVGRCADALAFVEEHLPSAFRQLDTSPLIAVQLLTARNSALMRLGRAAESRALSDDCLAIALAGESIDGAAAFGLWAGRARVLAGDMLGARRHLIEAEALLAERDPLGLRPWALALTAQAAVWGGDLDAAHRALADAEAIPRCERYYDGDVHLARVLLATAERRTRDATVAIAEAVAWAERAGMPAEHAIALHASVRLGAAAEAAGPLAAVAAGTDNPFVTVLADHARAVAGGDAPGCEAAAATFAELSCNLLAGEAAWDALAIRERAGDGRAARALSHRAAELAAACPGAHPPWWTHRNPPPTLTRREHEIARLAASGLPSRTIADRLVVSVRTVDSHLYRVYTKLGVRDRAGLAAALDG